MIITNQEDNGGGKKQFVQRWPLKSLINQKRSRNRGGNYPYNEQTLLDEVKEQTVIVLESIKLLSLTLELACGYIRP